MADTSLAKRTKTTEPSTDLQRKMQEHAGEGVSTKAADNLVPQVIVLQAQSPLVLDGKGKAGQFYVNDQAYDEIFFQLCAMRQTWLEFKPLNQGGGFVAEHEFREVEGQSVPPPGTTLRDRFNWKFASGNEAIHYRQMAGILWPAPNQNVECVIPFKSTGHTIARDWMTKANLSNRFPNGKPQALWAHVWQLKTAKRTNSSGTWYVVDVGRGNLLGSVDAEAIVGDSDRAFDIGLALANAFKANERVVDVASDADRAPPNAPF